AEDATTPDKKITGGTGTCTVDVLGVSDNNATANTIATWSLNSYECAAGQYLDETTLLCTECPVGSYCPGGTFTVETNNSKTACPADYTSDVAATAESECYMGCELACSTNAACPAHSNNCTHSEFKTTGKQYVDATCNAYPSVCPVADFACDTGYSKITISADDVREYASNYGLYDSSLFGYFTYICLNEGVDGNEYNAVNDCDYTESNTSNFLDFFIYDLHYSEKKPSDFGNVKTVTWYEAENPDENVSTVTAKYLENANFIRGGNGEHLWARLTKYKVPTYATKFLEEMYRNNNEIIMYVFLPIDYLMADFEGNVSDNTFQKIRDLAVRVRSGTINSLTKFETELQLIATNAENMEDTVFITEELLPGASYMYEILHLHKTASDVLQPKTMQLLQDFSVNVYSGALTSTEQAVQMYRILFSTMQQVELFASPWFYVGENMSPDALLIALHDPVMNIGESNVINPTPEIENLGRTSYCTANIINIDWNPDNGDASTQNMCIYDGAVSLPSDPVRPGYTFMGWKLVE
ncbi:MAG: hypothetical protein IKB59_02240, partial [Alphaproteobacteria bacterium]|nr:hypothetical protein [Alphaproteobacteria bacterium]